MIANIELETRQDFKKHIEFTHVFFKVKFVKKGTVESNIDKKMNSQNIINLFMQIVTKH